MHIDHSKLVELLVEATGLDEERVKTQLNELIEEIHEAISEGDAYEVDGFGLFSGIGDNILFVPSDDLATEINYKYAGMEPIELDEAPEEKEPAEQETTEADEGPFSGILDESEDSDEDAPIEEEPSKDIIEEFTDAESEGSVSEDIEETLGEKPGIDDVPYDPEKPEEEIDKPFFSGLLDDIDEPEPSEEEAAEEQTEESLEPESVEEKTTDVSDQEEEDFLAIFDEDADLEPQETQDEIDSDEETEEADIEETTVEAQAETEQEAESIEEKAIDDKEQGEDEDTDTKGEDNVDPFEELAGEEEDDEPVPESIMDDLDEEPEEKTQTAEEEADEEDPIPVITNLASEESKKKKEKAKTPTKKSVSTPTETSSPPVMLWVLLIIVVLAGGTYGLGYFGMVNIPGITPEDSTTMASSEMPQQQQATPPTQEEAATGENETDAAPQEEETQTEPEQPAEPEEQQPGAEPEQEQQQAEPEAVTETKQTPAPEDQPIYGLNGTPIPEANDGYTIVLYSLSNQASAQSAQNELSDQGYRALLAEIPSQQYGTLWRVSLGQFETMRDAAIAVENMDQDLLENYFITNIQ